jgi:hypothetical protein
MSVSVLVATLARGERSLVWGLGEGVREEGWLEASAPSADLDWALETVGRKRTRA